MIKAHHAGKMGDVVYALPVLRALHRIHGQPIHLTTSGLCHGLVPLLWEQPYLADVVVDETRAYQIPFGVGVTNHWDFYQPGEGYNLSLQPKHYELDCPISWTMAYAWIAGVELTAADFVGLPSLVNHRNWHHQVKVAFDGVEQTLPPTVIVAPEVESLEPAPSTLWVRLMDALMGQGFDVVLVGKSRQINYRLLLQSWRGGDLEGFHDVRGLTTVPTLARMVAEAHAFIGAHSFPWHLARQARTPAICLQEWREGLRRCVPVDTPAELAPWVDPKQWSSAVDWILTQTRAPQLTGGAPCP